MLGEMLGQISGVFNSGELRFIWDRGLSQNWKCGCGSPFLDCSVWRKIIDRVFGEFQATELPELIALREKYTRSVHFPLWRSHISQPWIRKRTEPFLNAIAVLLSSIREVSECELIVDTSKFPNYGYILDLLPGVEVYGVHLVRDPRATAFSWMRTKFNPASGGYMRKYSSFKNAMRWNARNSLAELMWRKKRQLGRSLRLRYEDLITDPEASIRAILSMVGRPDAPMDFVRGTEVELAPTHSVSGNPVRFAHGPVNLRIDDAWKHELAGNARRITTILTLPLLTRYGYTTGAHGGPR